MSEIKKGTIVKAWDEGDNNYRVGFYQLKACDTSRQHKVSEFSNGAFSGWHCHVEPLPLMPPLPEGVKIGDEVEMSDKVLTCWDRRKLSAATSDGRFVDDYDIIWGFCRQIRKTEKRVADLDFIYRWLHQNGFELLPKSGGHHTRFSNRCGLVYTLGELDDMAGREISKVCQYKVPEDWIVEVPR